MLIVKTPIELTKFIGQKLGPSDWLEITQDRIDKFADCTSDHQWIHVDPDRSYREMPGKTTIAHGWLTLSLLPNFTRQLYRIENKTRGINYGVNKARFIKAVPCGSRIRAWITFQSIQPKHNGMELLSDVTIELEHSDRPAVVAECLTIVFAD